MFDILPPLLIIVGLVGLIVIFNHSSSKENMLPLEEGKEKIWKGNRFFQKISLFFEKVRNYRLQSRFLSSLERLLVRLRIVILKLDKSVSKNLIHLRKGRMKRATEEKVSSFSSVSSVWEEGDKELPSSLSLDFSEEEKKILRRLNKFPQEVDTLINLARIYLWKKDFSSARAVLLQAYEIDEKNKVIRSLLVELKEKEENIQQSGEDKPE